MGTDTLDTDSGGMRHKRDATASVTVDFGDAEAPMLSTESGLEESTCTLEYLNEGGANFVFRILQNESGPLPASLQGRLLRLRKNLPHVQDAASQLKAYEQNFKSLFPAENLVHHELINLDISLPLVLNSALSRLARPSHRAQEFLPEDEQYGMLVTDMTPGFSETLLQLKPKWLTQSPNAPPDSVRCRTCALRAQRASRQIRTATDQQESCPLELISSSSENRRRAASRFTDNKHCIDFLVNDAQALLATLRAQQLVLDKNGVLEASKAETIYDVCRAMTLRDCTLFIKRSEKHVEARLGDLDLKQPQKLAKWQEMERSLINDGWYMNTEATKHWTKEATCLLSR